MYRKVRVTMSFVSKRRLYSVWLLFYFSNIYDVISLHFTSEVDNFHSKRFVILSFHSYNIFAKIIQI